MAFKGNLHPYQEEAVDRLVNRRSLLLAYGCGTGKTVMAIAAAERLLESGEVNQVLVLCPASLKYQWQDKIRQFTDSKTMVIDGPKVARQAQYSKRAHPDYIICSYDSLIHDYEDMTKIIPEMVIADEASAIKSFKAMRSKRVKKLFGKTPYRLGLTATPIENRPEELYSIMQWVDSTVLGRYDLFDKAYIRRNARGWPIAYKNLDVLRDRMGGSLARKTRHDPDVRPYLPDVDEDNWYIDMDAGTLKAYKHIAKDMLSQMEENPSLYGEKTDLRFIEPGFDESTPDGKLMAMYMCMEMLLDFPDLIWWSGTEYEKDSPNGSAYAHQLMVSGVFRTGSSPKLDRLIDETQFLLDSDEDSKVIVVSKYKFMLGIIEIILEQKGIKSVSFTGDLNARQKAEVVEQFNQPDTRVFLTSYAGGYGLDLYMADYLINYDLPWSAGTKDQINSRHIRASSGFGKVYIRNMIVNNTVEERKLRILDRKGQLLSSVIDGTDTTTVDISGDYLRTHLEKTLNKDLTGHSRHGTIVTTEDTHGQNP